MKQIKWCLNTKNGLELIEPNENLAKAYLNKSEDALRAASALHDNKDWRISSLYYTQYFSLYAILMKIGVKCEIHSCTLAFMEFLLKDFFTFDEKDLIKKSMKARTDTQYYSDRNVSDEFYLRIIKETPMFLIKCKGVLNKLTETDINKIREELQ